MNISNLQRFRVLPRNSNMAVLVTRKDDKTLILQREGEDRKDAIDQHDLFVLLGDGWSIINIEELVAPPASAGQVSVGVSLDGADDVLEQLEDITAAADKAVAALQKVTRHSLLASAATTVAVGALARAPGGQITAEDRSWSLGKGGTITSDYVISKEQAAKLAAASRVTEGYKIDGAVNTASGAAFTLLIGEGDKITGMGFGDGAPYIADRFVMRADEPVKVVSTAFIASPDAATLDAAQYVRTDRAQFSRHSLTDNWACDCNPSRTFTTAQLVDELRGITVSVNMFPLDYYKAHLHMQIADAAKAMDYAKQCSEGWNQSFIENSQRVEQLRNTLAGLGE